MLSWSSSKESSKGVQIHCRDLASTLLLIYVERAAGWEDLSAEQTKSQGKPGSPIAKVILLTTQPRVPPQTGISLSLKDHQRGYLIITGGYHHLPVHNQVANPSQATPKEREGGSSFGGCYFLFIDCRNCSCTAMKGKSATFKR